ncbi:hypothetical protein BGZ57DRAFT_983675 [Hyaloscypha finlandica]|nr:hypothetical protein BGZ57DRAFT_983675 [Hyaloscypha finlandica]
MRLLDSASIKLHEFIGRGIPKYVILSHTWGQESQICYAYLEDIIPRSTLPPELEPFPRMPDLRNSRWFRRGWTLQELIAPPIVEFYDRNWFEVGTKLSLLGTIAAITRIDIRVLENSQRLDSINVASRMSWASERKTTRKEDEAYCLMGIFGVNMPLLYGEGHRAFHRLQEEIMKIHDDYTLFAWTVSGTRLTDHATYPRQSLPGHGDGTKTTA